MSTGVITWFNQNKGYGFLYHKGESVFVHYSAIKGEYPNGKGDQNLEAGQVVHFDLIEGPKGPQAANVTKFREVQNESA